MRPVAGLYPRTSVTRIAANFRSLSSFWQISLTPPRWRAAIGVSGGCQRGSRAAPLQVAKVGAGSGSLVHGGACA